MKPLIQKLVETDGPPGYEGFVREVIRSEIQPLVDELHVDALGNLIAVTGQVAPNGKRIMLAAHMDEIGLMVTHVDEQGFARFTNLGAVKAQHLPGSRVRFLNSALGVIGRERAEEGNNFPDLNRLYIDLGATSRETCPVHIGDVAVFERPFADLGRRWIAKAMDDRVGVAVLIETLRQIRSTPHQLLFVFSAQEEVGVRGATTAAFSLDPDIGLAVDVTDTGDTPKGIKMEVSLGKGPAIKVRDSGMLTDPRLVAWMQRVAENAGLPYQLEILERGSTDARAIQLSRAGVPTGCLSIPCRYIHAPSEMVDSADVENAVRLLLELLSRPANLS